MITAATGDVDLLDKDKYLSNEQPVNVKLTCQSKSSRTLPSISSPPLHSLRCVPQADTSKKEKAHWASQKRGCQSKETLYFNSRRFILQRGLCTLWIALLLVALKLPKRRPWNPDLKESTESSGLPGE